MSGDKVRFSSACPRNFKNVSVKQSVSSRRIKSASLVSCVSVQDGLTFTPREKTDEDVNESITKSSTYATTRNEPLLERSIKSPRASRLLLGSGKLRLHERSENVELHIDAVEFIQLASNRPDVTQSLDVDTIKHRQDVSPRKSESPFPLPKTYATKSGPLFLFSENKVLNNKVVQEGPININEGVEVHGQKMPTHQLHPSWSKVLQDEKKKMTEDNRTNAVHKNRRKRRIIGLGIDLQKHNSSCVNQLQETKTDQCRYIKLSHLSDAVLNYRNIAPTVTEKYLTVSSQTQLTTRFKSINKNMKDDKLTETELASSIVTVPNVFKHVHKVSIINKHQLPQRPGCSSSDKHVFQEHKTAGDTPIGSATPKSS